MKTTKIVVLALLAVSVNARADLSLKVFQEMSKGNRSDQSSIEMYVGGVVKGYLNANGFLAAENKSPLFCYDGDIRTDRAKVLTSQAVSEHLAKVPGDRDKEMTELLILMKLRKMYPCKS